jgi:hypothetical protein
MVKDLSFSEAVYGFGAGIFFLGYQSVVQVWIREQKVLWYPQALFVESAHGDGHA